MFQNSLSFLQAPNQNMLLQPSFLPPHRSLFLSSASTTTTLLPLHWRPPSSPISCSAFRDGGRGRERRPPAKWNEIYKKISLGEDSEIGASDALKQWENEGKSFSKWELCRVVRELRKFRKYKLALQVYEWMNARRERFQLYSSDMAVQLDLIAKVHGVASAEEFFIGVPEIQKDNRVYGALLNSYVGAKVRDKAEMLMATMKDKGYVSQPLPYNVMMTLYMKLKEYDKIDTLISEMKNNNTALDLYSYNIWLSARGSQGSLEGVEEVFEAMKNDESVDPNWSTFGTMATLYIRMGQLEKAEECLKGLESKIVGRNRLPYHYLINLYGSVGNRKEVHRVWGVYKSLFYTITNWGYHAIINSLVRVGDGEGAEKIYEEWLSVKTMYDTRITNALLSWYVNEGEFEKAERFFDRIGETGGVPIASSWDILAGGFVKRGKIPDALNCFRQAAKAEGSEHWKPKPVNVSAFLELCEREGDEASKEEMVVLLRQQGCSEDQTYRSVVSEYVGAEFEKLMGDYSSSDNGNGNGGMGNEGSESLFSLAE